MSLRKILLSLAALYGLFISNPAHATCSNYTTYSDGQVLTAASLNALQSNYTNCINDVLNGDTFSGNMNWHSGADAIFYSDTGSTKTAEVLGEAGDINLYSGSNLKIGLDGATGAIIGLPTQAGQTTNCGISTSGSTVTIAGYDGTALSTTNPCVVAVRSNTAGRVALAYFTSNVTFTFGAASNTDDNTWGITATANWDDDLPMFLGVIWNGTTPYFTIARGPLNISGSASTDLCQKDDTDCDSQTDVMILSTGLTLASFVDLPITQVGWFKWNWTTTSDNWDSVTIDSKTGFNKEYKNQLFTMPSGQMGSTASRYWLPNTGTVPQFSTNNYLYAIDETGEVTVRLYQSGDGGTDGASTVVAQVSLPYSQYNLSAGRIGTGTIRAIWANGANTNAVFPYVTGTNSYFTLEYNNGIAGIVELKNDSFTAGSREISGTLKYKAF